MSVGVIVRDHDGKVLASGNHVLIQTVYNWLSGSGGFCGMEGLKIGRDLGIHNIILEGDALKIVHLLRNEGQSQSRYDNLIDDLNTMLNNLHSWYVKHVKREANIVAHHLAKAALQQLSEQIWMEEYIPYFYSLYCNFWEYYGLRNFMKARNLHPKK